MSLLSESLKMLLGDTPLEKPEEGCRTVGDETVSVLDVSWEEACQWLGDLLLPSPAQLQMLIDHNQRFPTVTPSTGLTELLDRPLVEVAKARLFYQGDDLVSVWDFGLGTKISQRARDQYTLGSYMLSEQRNHMIRRLSRLPWREQQDVLFRIEKQVRNAPSWKNRLPRE